jgi:hypothetical protein
MNPRLVFLLVVAAGVAELLACLLKPTNHGW